MRKAVLFASLLALIGCSGESAPLTAEEQAMRLDTDLKAMFAGQQPLEAPLTLPQAMARGVAYNLDHRVAAWQKMIASGEIDMAGVKALPELNAGARSLHRNRDEIIRAENAATGAESLPPSVFRENDRREAMLEASWDLLDIGLATVQARAESDRARIAEEQRRKVVHNIIQDVRTAYWRAAALQVLGERINMTIGQARTSVADLDALAGAKNTTDTESLLLQQARLLQGVDDLLSVQADLHTAKAELAALINLPPGQDFTLAVNEGDILAVPGQQVDVSTEDLELVSLMIRPELRRSLLMSRVSASDTRAELLSSFPGLEVAFGHNYDSNAFLENNNWSQFSVGLAGNLMRLFTLPVRMEHMRNKEKLTDMQRQATTLAVMTQVHIARARLHMAETRLGVLRGLMRVNRQLVPEKPEGAQSPVEDAARLEREMNALLARAHVHTAFADYQNAYGRLLNSVGLDPLPPLYASNDIDTLAATIESRTERLTPNIFSKLVTVIRQKMPQGTAPYGDPGVQAASAPAPSPLALGNDQAPFTPRSKKPKYNE